MWAGLHDVPLPQRWARDQLARQLASLSDNQLQVLINHRMFAKVGVSTRTEPANMVLEVAGAGLL